MDAKDLEHFRELILKKKEEVLASLGYIKNSSLETTPQDQAGDLSSYSFHMADDASNTSERDIAMSLASREGRYLYNLNEALERIKKGTFGICRSCGKEIPKGRLEAALVATECMNCKTGGKSKTKGK